MTARALPDEGHSSCRAPADRPPAAALAGGALGEIVAGRCSPALFLDYDGTLTAIVDRPEDARLSPATRDVLWALTRLCPIAVVSAGGPEPRWRAW